jgi:protein-S-isoprenylcysteine O-methyltransferase Ste14
VRTRARVSDVVRFAFFAAVSVALFRRMPEMRILLSLLIGKWLFAVLQRRIGKRPQADVYPVEARFAAYAAMFLQLGLFHAALTWSPASFAVNAVPRMAGVGGLILLAGTVLVAVARRSLRNALILEAEAGHVGGTGALRFVRHPVSAAHALQYFAIWLVFPSILVAVISAICFGLTLTRIHFQEGILRGEFPEFETYKRRIGGAVSRPVRFWKWGPATLNR